MKQNTFYAVIADKISTEIEMIKLDCNLTDLNPDDVQELVEMLADSNSAYKDVLKGTRVAVIFDGKTGDRISINGKK